MYACQVSDIKEFMSKLLLKETFDSFYLVESTIVTYNTFMIDGRLKEAFFSIEEWEEKNGKLYSTWETLRPICFQLIKGKKTPHSLKVVFRLTNEEMEQMISKNNLSFRAENIAGLFLNIKYENNTILCTTGTALKTFTMDKSLEQFWDGWVRQFLKDSGILAEDI